MDADGEGLWRGVLDIFEARKLTDECPEGQNAGGVPSRSWGGWDAIAVDLDVDADHPAFRVRQATKIALQADMDNLNGKDVHWDEIEARLTAILMGDITATQLPSTQADAAALLAQPVILLDEHRKRKKRSEYNYLVAFQGQREDHGEWYTKGELKKEFPDTFQSMLATWKARKGNGASGPTGDGPSAQAGDTLGSNQGPQAEAAVAMPTGPPGDEIPHGAGGATGWPAQQPVEDPQASAVQGFEFNGYMNGGHEQAGGIARGPSPNVSLERPADATGAAPSIHPGQFIPTVYDPMSREWTALQPLPPAVQPLITAQHWQFAGGAQPAMYAAPLAPVQDQPRPTSRSILSMLNQTHYVDPLVPVRTSHIPRARPGVNPLIAANLEYAQSVGARHAQQPAGATGVPQAPRYAHQGWDRAVSNAPIMNQNIMFPQQQQQQRAVLQPAAQWITANGGAIGGGEGGAADAAHNTASPAAAAAPRTSPHSTGKKRAVVPGPPRNPPQGGAASPSPNSAEELDGDDAKAKERNRPASNKRQKHDENKFAFAKEDTETAEDQSDGEAEDEAAEAIAAVASQKYGGERRMTRALIAEVKEAVGGADLSKNPSGGGRRRKDVPVKVPMESSYEETESRLAPERWASVVIEGAKSRGGDIVDLWLKWPDGYKDMIHSNRLLGSDKVHCMLTLIKFYESKTTKRRPRGEPKAEAE